MNIVLVDWVRGLRDTIEAGLGGKIEPRSDMVEELVGFVGEGHFEGVDWVCWVLALDVEGGFCH